MDRLRPGLAPAPRPGRQVGDRGSHRNPAGPRRRAAGALDLRAEPGAVLVSRPDRPRVPRSVPGGDAGSGGGPGAAGGGAAGAGTRRPRDDRGHRAAAGVAGHRARDDRRLRGGGAGGSGRGQGLSGGISEALITTATGLSIGIPSLVAYNWLVGRAERLVLDIEAHTNRLMKKILGFSTTDAPR
ncbi:MAG: MotA/TolQ/ExbB proton channel family protein [Gemmatimonadetes bacterium]|nr:MotA/TolQ/ExbB proton channel family protein [Gemmatimonadota bacterium]